MKTEFKINGIDITDKQYNSLPFGRQIEFHKKIQEFKSRAKKIHVSQKRTTHTKAMREFKDLHKAVEWFTQYEDSPTCRDDSFEVFYTTKDTQ